jgi:hypothetical protein
MYGMQQPEQLGIEPVTGLVGKRPGRRYLYFFHMNFISYFVLDAAMLTLPHNL